MKLQDFEYELPSELIARYPLEKRSASRLLCLNSETGAIVHRQFADLIELISPNDLLVCNNTQVIAARLMGHKQSGGKIEMLVERVLDEHRVLAHIRASKSPKPQSLLIFQNKITFEVIQRHDDLFELRCHDPRPVLDVIEDIGQIPLPPYFHRQPEESDKERYQTIYAAHKGSVAAPTAGLHFDHDLFKQLKAKNVAIAYVTLHIGAGTFAPVRVENITEHRMHAEYIVVSPEVCEQVKKTKACGGRIIAVGTTAARSLETASRSGQIQPFTGDTDIFIYPGFQFNCVDALITNLHLPGSTLLMLVSALGGYENIKYAYQAAVEERYRFFSYGDAMFVF
jgi:S-adenosylmethionine:tRNA ribosyltransferase-isomerase